MTDKPIEQVGVPSEEQIDDADPQADNAPQVRSESSADDPSSAQPGNEGRWTSSSR